MLRSSLILAAALAIGASSAAAQSDSRVAASANAGVAAGSSDTGVAAGGAVLVDVHDRISIEGQGTYLDRGRGADAFAAAVGVLVNLLPAGEPLVPYAAFGGGVYRVSFDLGDPRFLGPIGARFAAGNTVCPAPGSGFGFGPGPGLGAGSASCPANATGYWGVGALPRFYARRLGPLVVPRAAAWEARAFTDPALSFGGGLRFNVSDRLMVRPDARAVVIVGDGDTHTIGVFVAHVAYRF